MTDRSELWHRWLLIVVIAVGTYAVGLVVAGGFVGSALFDPLGFGPESGDIADGTPTDYVRFIFAVLGAVIVGWMATLAAIVRGPLRRGEPWAWWAVAASVGVWFTLDTGISIALGFVSHGAFNLVFLAALAVPLIGLRPSR